MFLTLEGEMGLLVAWGDDANFVLSAGGFHPRFNPPPLPFPAPKRIAISLLNTDIARIRTETLFRRHVEHRAVRLRAPSSCSTSTIARVDGHMAFDALFQFSPFYFIIEISASVSLKVFGVGLFSIHLEFELSRARRRTARTAPARSASSSSTSRPTSTSPGARREDTTLPPIAVMPLLRDEFDKAENWRAELPPQNNLLVSLRKLPESESAQVLHPLGSLRVSQRAVPLDLKIDKVGNQKPSDANEFELDADRPAWCTAATRRSSSRRRSSST